MDETQFINYPFLTIKPLRGRGGGRIKSPELLKKKFIQGKKQEKREKRE
jgi:hypothetical protein